MISILGTKEAQARRRPTLAGWRSVLVLEFEDMQELDPLDSSVQWPMEPTVSQHDQLLGYSNSGGCVPSLSHARKIIEFVSKHHESNEELNLVVHCQAGVSRSVMVVHHAQKLTGAAVDVRVAAFLPHANQRLGRLLTLARMQHEMRMSNSEMNTSKDSNTALRPL